MKEHLLKLIGQVQDVVNDAWNPETYFDTRINGADGMLHSRYVLGNLFAKGYTENTKQNFEIFKDHSGWQIWVWDFDSQKNKERNTFNCPYYAYDKLVDFIEKTF